MFLFYQKESTEADPEPAPEPIKELDEEALKELQRKQALVDKFPDQPTILVHPNRAAKGGKFDCTIMSLSVLLDYRPEDNKEHSFEVYIPLRLVL